MWDKLFSIRLACIDKRCHCNWLTVWPITRKEDSQADIKIYNKRVLSNTKTVRKSKHTFRFSYRTQNFQTQLKIRSSQYPMSGHHYAEINMSRFPNVITYCFILVFQLEGFICLHLFYCEVMVTFRIVFLNSAQLLTDSSKKYTVLKYSNASGWDFCPSDRQQGNYMICNS